MIITLVFVDITHKTARQSTVGMQAFYTIKEIAFTISMCISMAYAYACAIRITVLYMCI